MNDRMEETRRTEILLQDLMAECGEIIRTQLRPAMRAAQDHHQSTAYTASVVALVRIAARAGEAVARLRGTAPQSRHHITVERVTTGGGRGEG
ncbi:MAG: hypothetical protein JO256_13080 [Alphaproteobacteria bacterium]|nr:hypothetical protein [Alphaproteobacteria bacterium]